MVAARALCLMLALTVALPDGSAAKDTEHNQSPFRINLALDLGITLGAPAVFAMPRFFLDEYITSSCGLD